MFDSRLLRRIAQMLVAIVAVLGVTAGAAQAQKDSFIEFPAHKYPAFYVPPSPLPYGEPGTIIRAQRMSFTKSVTKPPRGTIGWLVMFHSRSALGADIAVTGIVLVPQGYNPVQGVANRPIVSYGNEAEGLSDASAQSSILQWAQSGEVALYQDMLKRGYAVVAADYEGLGTPDVHTFGVTLSAAHTTLDMVRAARNLTDAGLPKDGEVGLLGYSQGGAAVGGAEEQQPEYAPDVKLTAVAAGGAPIDPKKFSKFNDGQFFSAVNFAAAAGYDAAYPELDLKSFLNERGLIALKHTYTAGIESIFSLSFKRTSAYLKDPSKSPLDDPRWIARFKENQLGFKPPVGVPTYYFHAVGDEATPYSTAKTLRRQWCAGGTELRFVPLIFTEHVASGPLWMPQAEKWLDQQLKGNIDKGNCGQPLPFGTN